MALGSIAGCDVHDAVEEVGFAVLAAEVLGGRGWVSEEGMGMGVDERGGGKERETGEREGEGNELEI